MVTNLRARPRVWRFASFAPKLLTASLLLTAFGASAVVADDSFLSDSPMETSVQKPPANLVFVYDDSGSMDWEMITAENNGAFNGSISDIWRTYTSSTRKRQWQGQWPGYNKLSYNPNQLYTAWPQMPTLTLSTIRAVRLDPVRNVSPYTVNLKGGYTTLSSDGAMWEFPADGREVSSTSDLKQYSSTSEFVYSGDWEKNGEYFDTIYTQNEPASSRDWAGWKVRIPKNGTYSFTLVNESAAPALERNCLRFSKLNSSNSETNYYARYQNFSNITSTHLGSYYFDSSEMVLVYLDPDCMDTSKISPAGSPWPAKVVLKSLEMSTPASDVNVRFTHYYKWIDHNNNNTVNDGEVYLVNFSYPNSQPAGVLDEDYSVTGDAGTPRIVREFYRVGNSGSSPASQARQLKRLYLPPEELRATFTDAEGVVTKLSPFTEVENFINWFGYYRSRDLAAKNSIATSVAEMTGVRVGMKTLNNSKSFGVRPVHVNEASRFIADDRSSANFRDQNNRWYNSSAPSVDEYNGNSQKATSKSASAYFKMYLPTAGKYKVFARWARISANDAIDRNARYTVRHKGGDTTVRKNQNEDNAQFSSLGTYDFDAGNAYVFLQRDNSSTGSYTSADAVLFEENVSSTADETSSVITDVYKAVPSGGTPLHHALNEVGRYFSMSDTGGWNPDGTNHPFYDDLFGGTCQQSFAIMFTDGYYASPSGYTSSSNGDGSAGAPFADRVTNTLADLAWKYWNTDLAPSYDNVSPTNDWDRNAKQHLVTYTISFGVNGTIDLTDINNDGIPDAAGCSYATDPYFQNSCTPKPKWPYRSQPRYFSGAQRIDDLWHASVDGHGQYINAARPEQLLSAMREVLSNISARLASGAAINVSAQSLTTTTEAYQSLYKSGEWYGDIRSYKFNGTKLNSLPEWSAAELLQDEDWNLDRNIFTFRNGSTKPFRYANLSDSQKGRLGANGANVVEYVRGRTDIPGARARTFVLGDIVHSSTALVDDLLYVGANDGMLHIFDATNGKEKFSYVPNHMFAKLPDLMDSGYEHQFYIDQTPYAKVFYKDQSKTPISGGKTIVYGGYSNGGNGYYALNHDELNKDTAAEDSSDLVRWEYPKPHDSLADGFVIDQDLGRTYSSVTAAPTRVVGHRNVVFFGNGYASPNGKAYLYALDAFTGDLLAKIPTDSKTSNGLSTPALLDIPGGTSSDVGLVDFVYAGDLKGRIWKFDVRDPDPSKWKVFNEQNGFPAPFFEAGTDRPITTQPALMRHCSKSGYMVLFGTGKFTGENDRLSIDEQGMYGLWDQLYTDPKTLGAVNYSNSKLDGGISPSTDPYYLLEQTEWSHQVINGKYTRSLTQKTANYALDEMYNLQKTSEWKNENNDNDGRTDEDGAGATNDGFDNDQDGRTDEDSDQVHLGWYFNLPGIEPTPGDRRLGERVTSSFKITNGKLYALSLIPDTSACSGGGSSMLHIFNACTGAAAKKAQFDLNKDNKYNAQDMQSQTVYLSDGSAVKIMVPVSGVMKSGIQNDITLLKNSDGRLIVLTPDGEMEIVDDKNTGVYFWKNLY